MAWFWVIVGFVILIFAGDILVRGAVNLAMRLGIPALVVSLTVVAFGTSAPELLIAVSAVLEGAAPLALGNVVGSNTANVLLVLGVPALISRLDTSKSDCRSSFTLMLFATALFVVMAYFGPLQWWHGIIMLVALAAILFSQARSASGREEELEGADPNISRAKIALYLIVGMIGLPLGADILVNNASIIAADFGVPESVVGLTLVAIGTSLPELATTVVAAIRRHADVALGNVIGSNMFNALGILGVASLIGPIEVPSSVLWFDMMVMVAASLILIPFVVLRLPMGRIVGGAFTAAYVAYIFLIFQLET